MDTGKGFFRLCEPGDFHESPLLAALTDHPQAGQSFHSWYNRRSITPQHVDEVFDLRAERLFEVDAPTPGDGSRETNRVLVQLCIQ